MDKIIDDAIILRLKCDVIYFSLRVTEDWNMIFNHKLLYGYGGSNCFVSCFANGFESACAMLMAEL